LQKLTERNLSRQSPADVRALLVELESAATQIEHAQQMLKVHLPASDEG
jgi:hypothetical protein